MVTIWLGLYGMGKALRVENSNSDTNIQRDNNAVNFMVNDDVKGVVDLWLDIIVYMVGDFEISLIVS